MKKFKERWQIRHNWQLLFPVLGILGVLYLSYLFANLFIGNLHIIFVLALTLLFYFLWLKFFLWCFKKLEHKWIVTYRWEMIRIFIVFAITGSTSAFISKPLMSLIGITKENLNPLAYWVLYVIIGFIFYQFLLVFNGWMFGQLQFFWNFEKKILKRIGLKRFIE